MRGENLRLQALSQREDGLLELCSPARVDITIPVFSLAFIWAMEEYYRYSGDAAFAKENGSGDPDGSCIA